MNKKFFAALASATMAFTASGSIAVFADDFVEENTPSIDAGDLKPLPAKVVFNEENFGALVKSGAATFKKADNSSTIDLTEDEEYDTSKFKDIAYIVLNNTFEGEVKGLEYFTGLTNYTDASVKSTKKVTNKTLDFSANTALTSITVNNAKDLAELKLPNADEDEIYHLETLTVASAELPSLDLSKQEALKTLSLTNTQTTSLSLTESDTFTGLTLSNTKLTALDLSKQEELTTVTVTGNKNLKDVVVKNGKKGAPKKYATLNLSDNALETVNLDHVHVTGGANSLNLSKNHIGALDLSKTTANTPKLDDQTFFVSENAANVNLTEAFPELKPRKVQENENFDEDTGVLTLSEDKTTYTYEVSYNNGTKVVEQEMEVTLTAANPMHRLYNPNSGEHFYTADLKEKEALVALGWNDEGYGWVAAKTPAESEKAKYAVYRLYNPNAGDHHYTMNANEVKTLVAYGWKDEGTGWYSVDAAATIASQVATGNFTNLPVYRQYNPYANGAGAHNYTTDKAENDYLVSLGWTPEGVAWTANK